MTTPTTLAPGLVCDCQLCLAAGMLRNYGWRDEVWKCAVCRAAVGEAHELTCEILLRDNRHGEFINVTTPDILSAIRGKYTGEWLVIDELRLATGWEDEQRIDAWVCHPWPSKAVAISYEVKVSRSDWLREKKKPNKHHAAKDVSNYFYFIAPPGVIKPDELFEGTGLIEVAWGEPVAAQTNLTMATVVEAPRRTINSVPMGFVRSLARRATK